MAIFSLNLWMLLKRGMGNGEWGSAVIPKKIKLESAQYGKETRTARGKRNMEENIYLSV